MLTVDRRRQQRLSFSVDVPTPPERKGKNNTALWKIYIFYIKQQILEAAPDLLTQVCNVKTTLNYPE